ncbi:SH3 domain-containing protein [Roseovarius sp. C7]|uniref:SH3 domain-containing protein n=1 Tax=Roseovarius sp. C7 TaxID=3398643 RepID=UPI0039F6F994
MSRPEAEARSSAMGPVVFVGLTIYTIVMQPGPDGLADPADRMDMKAVQHAPEEHAPEDHGDEIGGAALAMLWPRPLVAAPRRPEEPPGLSQVAGAGRERLPVPVAALPPVTVQSHASGGLAPVTVVLAPVRLPGGEASARRMVVQDLPRQLRAGEAPRVLPLPEPMQVTGDAVHLRSGPATRHDILGKLTRGAQVWRLGTRGNWSRVSLVDAAGTQSGWIYSTYLERMQP